MLELRLPMQISTDHIAFVVLVATFIFLVAAVFLLLYVDLYNRRKKRYREETLLLKRQFEEELTKTQLEVQEQTLQTIASDIHDNVGQLLSITKLTLGTVDTSPLPERGREKVSNALELLNTSIRELRQMASVLHAGNLLKQGLEHAVANELKWLSKSDQYTINLNVSGSAPGSSNSRHELIAFRLIQELLNNTIKHARASEISVLFDYQPGFLNITIADNGIGFDVAASMDSPVGLGLHNLFNRARIIGGTLDIQSFPGRGTIACLKLIDQPPN